jgi:MOSC domain-containing protein YiiM
MDLVSINVGHAERIQHGSRSMVTGICKRPVGGATRITAQAVGDDEICDLNHHGGPDQVVYAYSLEDYEWWSEQLGTELGPGTFGDNLTIRGLPTDLAIGDRLVIGEVVLEATSPRIPCSTFATRMQDPNFGLAFRRAERPGIYFRVLNEGDVAAGDPVELVDGAETGVSVVDLFRLSFELSPDKALLERCLAAPIAERIRLTLGKKLAAA